MKSVCKKSNTTQPVKTTVTNIHLIFYGVKFGINSVALFSFTNQRQIAYQLYLC